MAFLVAVVILVGVFVLAVAFGTRTDEEIIFTVRLTGLLIAGAFIGFLAFGVLSIAAEKVGLVTFYAK